MGSSTSVWCSELVIDSPKTSSATAPPPDPQATRLQQTISQSVVKVGKYSGNQAVQLALSNTIALVLRLFVVVAASASVRGGGGLGFDFFDFALALALQFALALALFFARTVFFELRHALVDVAADQLTQIVGFVFKKVVEPARPAIA